MSTRNSYALSGKGSDQSGVALVAVLLFLAALVPLGVFAAMQAQTDLRLQHRARETLQGFYVAEAGLEHALSDLEQAPWFDRLLNGPDGVVGTADDDLYPFLAPPPLYFPHPPVRYEVRTVARTPNRVEIVSCGLGAGAAEQIVVASVLRSAAPFLPGAVSSSAPSLAVRLGEGFVLDGSDSGGGAKPHPRLAATGFDAVESAGDGGGLRQGEDPCGGGDTPISTRSAFPAVEDIAADLTGNFPAAAVGSEADGELGEGLLVSSASLSIADATGAGILLVKGELHVRRGLVFDGLVMVLGDVRFEPESRVRIRGGLLQGRAGHLLHLLGGGSIRYDGEAIAAVDSAFPGVLPRRARVVGWHQVRE